MCSSSSQECSAQGWWHDRARASDGAGLHKRPLHYVRDVAVEVRVVRLLSGALADVDTGQGTERVSVALVSAVVGDTILVHAGEAIAVVGRVSR